MLDFPSGVDWFDLGTIGTDGLASAAYAETSVASDTLSAARTTAVAMMVGGTVCYPAAPSTEPRRIADNDGPLNGLSFNRFIQRMFGPP